MKPLFARYVSEDSFNSVDEAYVLFKVKLEDASIKEYRIYTDKDFQEPRNYNFDLTETLESERLELTNWQRVLFNTWIIERSQPDYNKNELKNELFHFYGNEETGFNCRISRNIAGEIFNETKENNSSSWIADTLQGCFSSAARFFNQLPRLHFMNLIDV